MSHEELVKLLKEAIAHHKAGRSAEAEPLYRQVLEQNPNVATALQNLGLILSQQNKKDEAIELMQKSVEVEPTSALYFRNLGAVCRGAERAQEAVAALRKATELAPDDGLCWADLGVSLDRAGYTMEALAVYVHRQSTAAQRTPRLAFLRWRVGAVSPRSDRARTESRRRDCRASLRRSQFDRQLCLQ